MLERLKGVWSTKRAGKNVQEVFNAALRHVVKHSVINKDRGGFLWRTDDKSVSAVRRPKVGKTTLTRRPTHIPREEYDLAVCKIIETAGLIGEDELSRSVAQVFGWSRRGADVNKAIDAAIRRARKEERLAECVSTENIGRPRANNKKKSPPRPEPHAPPDREPARARSGAEPSKRTTQAQVNLGSCVVCHGRFGDKSKPVSIEVSEADGFTTRYAHTTCYTKLDAQVVKVPGHRWNGSTLVAD